MYVLAAFLMDLIEIEKVHILNNVFFLTLFYTNKKCKRGIYRFTSQQYQTAIHFSMYNRKHLDCSVLVCSPIKITQMLMI